MKFLFLLLIFINVNFLNAYEVSDLKPDANSYKIIQEERNSSKLLDIYRNAKYDDIKQKVLESNYIPISLLYEVVGGSNSNLINTVKENLLYKILISKNEQILKTYLQSDNPSIIEATQLALKSLNNDKTATTSGKEPSQDNLNSKELEQLFNSDNRYVTRLKVIQNPNFTKKLYDEILQGNNIRLTNAAKETLLHKILSTDDIHIVEKYLNSENNSLKEAAHYRLNILLATSKSTETINNYKNSEYKHKLLANKSLTDKDRIKILSNVSDQQVIEYLNFMTGKKNYQLAYSTQMSKELVTWFFENKNEKINDLDGLTLPDYSKDYPEIYMQIFDKDNKRKYNYINWDKKLNNGNFDNVVEDYILDSDDYIEKLEKTPKTLNNLLQHYFSKNDLDSKLKLFRYLDEYDKRLAEKYYYYLTPVSQLSLSEREWLYENYDKNIEFTFYEKNRMLIYTILIALAGIIALIIYASKKKREKYKDLYDLVEKYKGDITSIIRSEPENKVIKLMELGIAPFKRSENSKILLTSLNFSKEQIIKYLLENKKISLPNKTNNEGEISEREKFQTQVLEKLLYSEGLSQNTITNLMSLFEITNNTKALYFQQMVQDDNRSIETLLIKMNFPYEKYDVEDQSNFLCSTIMFKNEQNFLLLLDKSDDDAKYKAFMNIIGENSFGINIYEVNFFLERLIDNLELDPVLLYLKAISYTNFDSFKFITKLKNVELNYDRILYVTADIDKFAYHKKDKDPVGEILKIYNYIIDTFNPNLNHNEGVELIERCIKFNNFVLFQLLLSKDTMNKYTTNCDLIELLFNNNMTSQYFNLLLNKRNDLIAKHWSGDKIFSKSMTHFIEKNWEESNKIFDTIKNSKYIKTSDSILAKVFKKYPCVFSFEYNNENDHLFLTNVNFNDISIELKYQVYNNSGHFDPSHKHSNLIHDFGRDFDMIDNHDKTFTFVFYSDGLAGKLIKNLRVKGKQPEFITYVNLKLSDYYLFKKEAGITLNDWNNEKGFIEDILQTSVDIEEYDESHDQWNELGKSYAFIIKESSLSTLTTHLELDGDFLKTINEDGLNSYYFKNVDNIEEWKKSIDKIVKALDKRVTIDYEESKRILKLKESIEESIPILLALKDRNKNTPKLKLVQYLDGKVIYFYNELPEIGLKEWKAEAKRKNFRSLFKEPDKVYELSSNLDAIFRISEILDKISISFDDIKENIKIYSYDSEISWSVFKDIAKKLHKQDKINENILKSIDNFEIENFKSKNDKEQFILLTEYDPIPTSSELTDNNLSVENMKENQVFYGYAKSKERYYIDINKITHTTIVGSTGSGKSNFMNGLITSLLYNLNNISHLYLMDLKGTEFNRYNGVNDDKITVFTKKAKPKQILDALYEVEAEMLLRTELCQEIEEEKIVTQPIFFIIDEFKQIDNLYYEKEERWIQDEISRTLSKIGSLSRSSNIKLLIQTQSPKDIPEDIRKHCLSRILLKTSIENDKNIALGNPDLLNELGINHLEFGHGRFVFEDFNDGDSKISEIQFPFVDKKDKLHEAFIHTYDSTNTDNFNNQYSKSAVKEVWDENAKLNETKIMKKYSSKYSIQSENDSKSDSNNKDNTEKSDKQFDFSSLKG